METQSQSNNGWAPTWEATVTQDAIGHYLLAFPGVSNSIHRDAEAAKQRIPGASNIVGPGAMVMGYLDEFICQHFGDGLMAGRVGAKYERHELEVDFKEVLEPGDSVGFFLGESRERDMKYGEGSIPCIFVDLEAKRRRGQLVTLTHKLKLILRRADGTRAVPPSPTETPQVTIPA